MKAFDVLQELFVGYLNLSPNQIWAYNNDFKIPNKQGIFIVLELVNVRPFANNLRYKTDENNNFVSEQYVLVESEIIVHFFSKNTEARENHLKFLLAFNSDLCQQIQENNQCHIARTSDLFDASSVEGASNLTRYDIRVKVITGETATISPNYYDNFEDIESQFEQ